MPNGTDYATGRLPIGAGGMLPPAGGVPSTPANAENMVFAELVGSTRRFDDALELNRRSDNLDPQNEDSWGRIASAEFFMGQLDQVAADGPRSS